MMVPAMREVLRTNDLVTLTYAMHLLEEAGIEHLLLDQHMSALEGSLGILPRRLVVAEEDVPQALRVFRNAALTPEQP